MDKNLPPIHPGEILLEEFLKPMGISTYRLAMDINIPENIIEEIINEKRSINANITLRLSRVFGLSDRFWINLQTRYDIEIEKDRLQDKLSQEVRIYKFA